MIHERGETHTNGKAFAQVRLPTASVTSSCPAVCSRCEWHTPAGYQSVRRHSVTSLCTDGVNLKRAFRYRMGEVCFS